MFEKFNSNRKDISCFYRCINEELLVEKCPIPMTDEGYGRIV